MKQAEADVYHIPLFVPEGAWRVQLMVAKRFPRILDIPVTACPAKTGRMQAFQHARPIRFSNEIFHPADGTESRG